MFSKSKLHSAKLKITKLQEKYSKNIVLEVEPNSCQKLTEVYNDTSSPDSSSKSAYKDEVSIKDKIKKQSNNQEENTVVENVKNSVPCSTDQIEDIKCAEFETINSLNESTVSTRKSSIKLASEISELSDVSNQLENICILSSSTDESSVLPFVNVYAPGNSQKVLTSAKDKIKSPAISSAQNLIKNLEAVQHEEACFEKSLSQTIDDSVSESKMSSIKEVMSMLDTDSDSTYSKSNDRNKYNEDITGYTQSESKNSSLEHSAATGTDVELYSVPESRPNTRQEQIKTANAISPSLPHLLNEDNETSNATSPSSSQSLSENNISKHISKVTLLTSNLKSISNTYKSDKRLKKEVIGQESSGHSIDETKNINKKLNKKKLILLSQKITSQKTSLKPCKRRPLLKSCKLIRYTETSDEYNGLSTHVARHNFSDSNIFYGKKSDHYCDEVIKQLMKNQIESTRHFIESHHQMYLHCCQAVKMLSENYVQNT
ncbi:uncharacterized protein LOC124357096 [Homalodisca vitripennis]|uniref:uncharacterized protein LOC124357096 n=1 Tax=Homalodisca vitripennis TaxID=197043 RepID=UPI001EEABF52|nr:uncharacterized protein LOC124357096 [Homalodisca vitripennis]